jgi:hypothetical protein
MKELTVYIRNPIKWIRHFVIIYYAYNDSLIINDSRFPFSLSNIMECSKGQHSTMARRVLFVWTQTQTHYQ